MANLSRQGLNAVGMRLPLYCGGQSFVGFGLTGTWVGTVVPQISYDGINFVTLPVTPFASGAAVSSLTANGNWYSRAINALAVQLNMTAFTSGTLLATIAASTDAS